MSNLALSLRFAEFADIPMLETLIADSARGLGRSDYSSAQIEAALGTVWGVDRELIRDRTYFVVEADGRIVGCGGWSKRKTLFGADAVTGRDSALLDPAVHAAKIRAFFVHPDWARRGIGRMLLTHCEAAARNAGFGSVELGATAPGARLYAAFGYIPGEPIHYPLPNGLSMVITPMRKELPGD